jgi:anti-anti-sigma factor
MELPDFAGQAVATRFEIRECREPDGTLILSVLGDLDIGSAPELAERFAGAASPLWSLVLDLNALESMDSSGLSVLLAATTRARERGCSVSLARPNAGLRRLLALANLDAVLPLRSEDSRPRRRGRRRFSRVGAAG